MEKTVKNYLGDQRMANENILTFRCKHRHNALSHPKCYLRYLNGEDKPVIKLPKVLCFDIETSPLKAFIFQKSVWKANVSSDQVISEWFMLSWSAKWLLDTEIMSERLTGKEALAEDDSRLVKSLWNLLNEADIVIAHNGDSFDIPNMNTRFIVHQLPPTSPYQTIDTMLVAKKQFGFTHNSLNALAKVLGLTPKMDTDFELWKNCVAGDDKALAYMQEYNKGDVETLEEVYMKLRPWIKAHPNLGLFVESTEPVCPNCGSSHITWTDKFYYTSTGKYQTFQCECGAYGRSRTTDLDKEVRKSLATSISR
jgi:uncharacterized Zn-finger protein